MRTVKPIVTAAEDSIPTVAIESNLASRIRVFRYLILALQMGPVLLLIIISSILSVITTTFAAEANIQDLLIQLEPYWPRRSSRLGRAVLIS
jgi:hypothetical protein